MWIVIVRGCYRIVIGQQVAPSGRSCPTDSYLGLTVKWGLDTTDDHHRVGTGTPSPLPLRAYLAERGLNWGAGLVPIGPIDAIPECLSLCVFSYS